MLLESEMGQNFSFGRHKEPSSPSSSEAVGTPDHRVLAVDPRSPTVEISRTPIEVDTSPKRQETDLTTPARNPRDLRRNVIERNMLKNAQAS
ncbi:hypothetical protein L596_018289 [Steinernema carpocapsae]|uniref:Uncharacterized protein n=1 Tax=Steinernema carpocapsae TaxID=34508 RepID=A0A4U5N582_STECR|nr:hypothetical protein L596_018289 [Steinernema carpocapsae]